ncbi:hypothetical protein ACJ41O_015208 [Fusarium nematophilum]
MTPRTPLQVISNWPGDGGQNERKVPTTLIYNPDGITVSSWGFLCAEDEDVPSKVRRECFKVFLDDPTLAAVRQKGLANAPRSTAEAQRFVTDYLGKIYMHVKETVESEMGRQPWKDKTVTFLFSVPTTWENLDVINVFKGCIQGAGFQSGGPNHSALVDLTEAEAAAVSTLKTSPIPFENGDLFLTVDAGGGTTDLALMRITIQMEGVSHDFSHAGLGMHNGCMLFAREEIQLLFDVQVQSIIMRIDEQLGWVTQNAPGERVKYMILSGGLGSSVYVRETLQRRYTNHPHPNATEVVIVPCRDPQLAVARGLLFDHQQKWETGSMPVLASRIARASYGVVVQQVYSPTYHFGEDIRNDPYERNKKWAINQIQWLIKKVRKNQACKWDLPHKVADLGRAMSSTQTRRW